MSPVVEAEGMTRVFGRPERVALQGVDLRVERGEVVALVGRSGSGRTTLLRILATQVPATSGRLRILGLDPRVELDRVRSATGILLSGMGVPEPAWSAQKHLRYFAAMHGLSTGERGRRIEALRAELDIAPADMGHPVGRLSEGTLRKVELARALLNRPQVLFLEDPSRDLDAVDRARVMETLETRAAQDDVAIVLGTHDPFELSRLPDRVVALAGGRIVREGPDLLPGGPEAVQAGLRKLLEDADPAPGQP